MTGFDLNPSTKYKITFYSSTNGKGSKIVNKYFTTLSAPKNNKQTAVMPLINVTMDLSMATLSGTSGNTVQATGTIQNFSSDTIYLNGLGSTLGAENLDFDRSYFDAGVIPHSYKSGEIYKGPLFGIVIDNNAKPGTYPVNFYIMGGKTSTDWQELTNQNLQITVQ
jgi:hypothetical protein